MSEEKKRFFDEFEFPNYDEWKNAAVAALKGAPFDKIMFTDTYEGITLKPIYNKEDINSVNHSLQEYPGFYPFNRGGSASGYIGKDFEISQYIPYPNTQEFNSALISDLQRGQNSVRLNFDKACVLHEDFTSDDINGRDICIATVEDLKNALNHINILDYPINIDAGIGAYPALAALLASIDLNHASELKGTLNFDFISEFAKEGKISQDLSRYLNEMYSIAKWSASNAPKFRSIGISAYEWHNAGANAIQELTVAIALGVFYLKQMIEKGLTIDQAAQRISFSLAINTNFFMEIAKFRAIRIIWSSVIKEFGGNEESQQAHIHAISSDREHTKLDPYVNMLRATSQVFSAVTGNCDSITVNHFDKEFGLPSEFSRRTARNTQNVIKYESHLDDTIDPAAGSYYIEHLTNEIVSSAWNEFLDIDKSGGLIEAITTGSIQKKIDANFNKRIENISYRKDIIVGVNKYANINEKPVETIYNFDNNKIIDFVKNYDAFINIRNNESVDLLLDEFESIFKDNPSESLVYAINTLKAGASLAELYNSIPCEIVDIIEVEPISLRRSTEIFEIFREAVNNYKSINGKNPNLDFVCFGSLRDWKARADFSNDFFSVGGFSNVIYDGINNIEEAHARIDFSKKRCIVICSTDEKYSEILVEFAKSVKQKNQENYIILAGYPKDMIDTYKEAGVDMFIHVKANIVECLRELYNVTGLTI